ncbi:MAG TPA: nickel insertion protein, partial [Candidatus Obscuribacterales bacterium]
LHRVGLGAGTKDFALPNILRLWLGSALTEEPSHQPTDHRHAHDHAHNHSPDHSHVPAPPPPLDPPPAVAAAPAPSPTAAAIEQRAGQETVVVLETQVDDLSPQAIGYVYDRLLQGGALDVFTHSALMKKSRPGHVITVIAYPDRADSCEQILLQETTTLGVRRMVQTRQRLRRAIVPVATAWGTIRMKLAYDPHTDTLLKAHPEYEDCAAIARQHHVPWRAVHQQALCQWQAQQAAAIALASTDAPSGKDPKQEEQSSPQGG